ncbi:MAG TPA: response regulator [Verrucomicrobiae bacterium]|jgi:two-component system, chemotaxis family, chemotaxis protein CheY|nr:response regulator [Verrucomicrobiae bacterium]
MSKTALIVDDSTTMRRMIGLTLHEAGFAVVEGANGQEGLNRLDGGPVDIIIADVHMPVMDGLSMVQAVRHRDDHRFTPILILTTEKSDNMKERGKQAGASGWIVKPFNPRQLHEVVCRLLRLPCETSSETRRL